MNSAPDNVRQDLVRQDLARQDLARQDPQDPVVERLRQRVLPYLPQAFQTGSLPWVFLLALLIMALMVVYIILGCLIDGISMVVLTAAVVMPAVKAVGIDLVWFGIFVVLVVEMAQITPPVGFNLFVLQGLTGRSMGYIALSALPFFVAMVAMVFFIILVPELATWLPNQMLGSK